MPEIREPENERFDSSSRSQAGPNLSLSQRRLQKISRDSQALDWWLAQMEAWELGNPQTSAPLSAAPAIKAARRLQPNPPKLPPRRWVLRALLFDGMLIEHPLVERIVRKWTVGGTRFLPPRVPDWWRRERSAKEIEDWRDRVRLWRELIRLRDSSPHPSHWRQPPLALPDPDPQALDPRPLLGDPRGGRLLPFATDR